MKKLQVSIGDRIYQFELSQTDGRLCIKRNGSEQKVDLVRLSNNRYSLIIGGRSHEIGVDYTSDGYTISTGARSNRYRVEDFEIARVKRDAGIIEERRIKRVAAPMPGLIVRIQHQAGDEVNKGEALVVMEAMKMENDIKSPMAGRIKTIHVSPGQSVDKGQILVEFD